MSNSCEHTPNVEIHRFEDAWMGSRRQGSYETERTYEPILCSKCGVNIRANKTLSKWIENV